MKLIKEIKSKTGELHFQRFLIFRIPFIGSLVLHKIYKADEDKHLHNHPWNFFNIILKGEYSELSNKTIEQSYDLVTMVKKPYMFKYVNKQYYHQILRLFSDEVVTLNFLFEPRSEWGYNVDGKFVQHEEYRKLKNEGKI